MFRGRGPLVLQFGILFAVLWSAPASFGQNDVERFCNRLGQSPSACWRATSSGCSSLLIRYCADYWPGSVASTSTRLSNIWVSYQTGCAANKVRPTGAGWGGLGRQSRGVFLRWECQQAGSPGHTVSVTATSGQIASETSNALNDPSVFARQGEGSTVLSRLGQIVTGLGSTGSIVAQLRTLAGYLDGVEDELEDIERNTSRSASRLSTVVSNTGSIKTSAATTATAAQAIKTKADQIKTVLDAVSGAVTAVNNAVRAVQDVRLTAATRRTLGDIDTNTDGLEGGLDDIEDVLDDSLDELEDINAFAEDSEGHLEDILAKNTEIDSVLDSVLTAVQAINTAVRAVQDVRLTVDTRRHISSSAVNLNRIDTASAQIAQRTYWVYDAVSALAGKNRQQQNLADAGMAFSSRGRAELAAAFGGNNLDSVLKECEDECQCFRAAAGYCDTRDQCQSGGTSDSPVYSKPWVNNWRWTDIGNWGFTCGCGTRSAVPSACSGGTRTNKLLGDLVDVLAGANNEHSLGRKVDATNTKLDGIDDRLAHIDDQLVVLGENLRDTRDAAQDTARAVREGPDLGEASGDPPSLDNVAGAGVGRTISGRGGEGYRAVKGTLDRLAGVRGQCPSISMDIGFVKAGAVAETRLHCDLMDGATGAAIEAVMTLLFAGMAMAIVLEA